MSSPLTKTSEAQGGSVVPIIQIPFADQQNVPPINDECKPLCDPEYLYQNARCFQYLRDISSLPVKQKQKNDTFQYTSQFLYGCYMPHYYSVLDFKLMDRFVKHIKWPKNPTIASLLKHKELIAHEQELFGKWLSNTWEEHLKNRRVNIIPFIEDYIKTACNFSNGFIKSHYNGSYISKMVIKYNRENYEMINKIELDHCQRIKSSEITSRLNLPQIDITDLEFKVSFTDGIYILPQKTPFMKDELCQTLSKEYSTDVNICLSSLKNIMNLEKPNSLWLIPVNILIDTDKRKTIYVGGSLSTGHFSQQEKSLYYLRKELKKKFIRNLSKTTDDVPIQNESKYNYDKWMLKVNDMNGDVINSYNLLIRNKPHVQGDKNTYKTNTETTEKVLIPKIEYQPEFGFEKISEEQLSEYWLDTYFRSPRCCGFLISIQYNMDIMMCKSMNSITKTFISDEKKQMHLQRLHQTIDKLTQLDEGEYFMLHNPKSPFEVNLYQSSQYGGFNLFNMYFVLQQTEVLDSMTWNPIEPDVLCPIHEHFKVAPCMFRPNPTLLNVQMISDQVNKFKKVKEMQEKIEKEQVAKRKRAKHEKNKIKRQSKKDNDSLIQMKRETMKNL